MDYPWRVDVKRTYVKVLNKASGKRETRPVNLVTLYLSDPKAVTDSGHYRISLVRRRAGDLYCVSALPKIEQSIWTNPSGAVAHWHTLGEEYRKLETLPNLPALKRWLAVRVGRLRAYLILRDFLAK